MKKISFYKNVFSILLFSIGTALASKGDKPMTPFGFNLGMDVGSVIHRGNLTGKDGVQTIKIKGSSPFIGGFMGYNYALNSSYFTGLEMFGKLHNAEYTKSYATNNGYIKERLSMKNSFGANVLLGVYNANKSVYLKVGGIQTKFRLRLDSTQHQSHEETVKKKGLLLGVGGDYFLTQKWGVGVGYDYISYKGVRFKDEFSANYRPDVHDIHVRIKYHF
jgi:opacity protein-like surface antigen